MAHTPPQDRASREDVLAWMRENGASYRRGAAHFGLPVDTVKSWEKKARQAVGASPGVRKGVKRGAKEGRGGAPDTLAPKADAVAVRVKQGAEKADGETVSPQVADGDPPLGRRADIIRRRLRGETLRTIAKAHGITHGAVSHHLASEEGRRVLAEVRASVVPEIVADIQERMPAVVASLYDIARGKKRASLGQVQAAVALMKFAGVEERTVVVQEGEVGLRMRVDEMTPDQVDAEIARLEAAADGRG